MPFGQTWILKMRMETVSGQPAGFFSLKAWPASQAEPAEWGITRQAATGVSTGSFMLVSHYADTTFGNVSVTSLLPNSAPIVEITNPADGSTIPQGDTVTLNATALDFQDGNITNLIVWNSDRDGNITGTGGSVSTSSLSIGTHEITAMVTDSSATPGSDTINLNIFDANANTPPTISAIANQSILMETSTGPLDFANRGRM
jgi:hypothetical protein